MSVLPDEFSVTWGTPRRDGYYAQKPLTPINQPVVLPPASQVRSFRAEVRPEIRRRSLPANPWDGDTIERSDRLWGVRYTRRLWRANRGKKRRLPDQDVADILILWSCGWPLADIAQAYGYPPFWVKSEHRWDFQSVLAVSLRGWARGVCRPRAIRMWQEEMSKRAKLYPTVPEGDGQSPVQP